MTAKANHIVQRPIVVMSNINIDIVELADGQVGKPALGGAAVYAATGAAIWWRPVAIVAGVGADLDAVTENKLNEYGLLSDGYVVRDPHSIQSHLTYFADGSRTESPIHGYEHFARLQVVPDDISDALLPAAGTYIFRDDDPTFWAQVEARKSELGVIAWEIQDDAAIAANRDAVLARLSAVDLFSINRAESQALFGTSNADSVFDIAFSTGVTAIMFRMGRDGALVATRDQRLRITPPVSQVVDVTGAGNAFTGGFLAGWIAQDGSLEEAARCAAGSAAHALAQTGPGNPLKKDNAEHPARLTAIEP